MVDIRWLCCKFKIGRSICRSPLDPPRSPVAAVSVGSARIPPTGRPVRSGLARWFRLYQFSSFRPFRLLLVPVRLPFRLPVCSCSFPFVRPVSFVPACLFSFPVLLVRLSGSFLVRLVQVSFGFAWFSFGFAWFSFGSGSCFVELVLCSRLLACRFIYIIPAYIIH